MKSVECNLHLIVLQLSFLKPDYFQEACEMWDTLEESFEQVGHTLELTVVGEGNINLKDSKIS